MHGAGGGWSDWMKRGATRSRQASEGRNQGTECVCVCVRHTDTRTHTHTRTHACHAVLCWLVSCRASCGGKSSAPFIFARKLIPSRRRCTKCARCRRRCPPGILNAASRRVRRTRMRTMMPANRGTKRSGGNQGGGGGGEMDFVIVILPSPF